MELLWEQAHVEEISTQLMEQALEEHLSILSNSNMFTTKDQLKKTYVFKCVDDIREVSLLIRVFSPHKYEIKKIKNVIRYNLIK